MNDLRGRNELTVFKRLSSATSISPKDQEDADPPVRLAELGSDIAPTHS